MTVFFYHYMDPRGRTRLYWQQAESAADCCALLADCGIYPIHLIGLQRPAFLAARGLSARQLAAFLRQLSMALAGGVQLLEALHEMGREQSRERYRAFFARLEAGVLAGRPLSEALRQEKGVAAQISPLIAIGERQGRLAQMLEEAYRHLDNQERLKRRLQQQLLYPLIVLAAVLLVGAVLSLVVIPALVRQFMGFNTEVPAFMRFFLLLHDVLAQYGIWLLLALAVAVVLLAGVLRAQRASGGLRALVMRVPLLRKYYMLRTYVPFARHFSQMRQSGVSVGETLELLTQTFSGSLFVDEIAAISEKMAQGAKLSQVLAALSFVPEMARQTLLNGERNGHLPQTLAYSADYYEALLLDELSMWVRLVEPLAIVLLGALVLFMALGLFVPVLNSYQTLLAQ